jgi:hypothetical protein
METGSSVIISLRVTDSGWKSARSPRSLPLNRDLSTLSGLARGPIHCVVQGKPHEQSESGSRRPHHLANHGTATVANGRDAYQCGNEKNQEFSVERELRIGGQAGILIHAHCYDNGNVKQGNSFHIKLSKDSHKGGCGVMLVGASRNTLIASFDSGGNLDEKGRTVGVVWR